MLNPSPQSCLYHNLLGDKPNRLNVIGSHIIAPHWLLMAINDWARVAKGFYANIEVLMGSRPYPGWHKRSLGLMALNLGPILIAS